MGRAGDRVAVALCVAVICVLGLVGVATAFLNHAAGQRVDETALRGARIGRGHLVDGALTVLGLVSGLGLVLALGTVAVIAFSRRRADLAIAVVVMVVGANVTTQALKTHLLERPTLGIHTLTLNSLPSGHSTVAASLAVALVLVVPLRLRGPLALFGAIAATLTGVATLAVGWHRPSDVVAAFFVVGAWLGLVMAGLELARRNVGRPASEAGRWSGPRWTVVLLLAGSVVALAIAGYSLWRTLNHPAIPPDRLDLLIAYAGGAAAIAGFAALLLTAALLVAPADERASTAEVFSAPGSERSR